VGQERLTVDGEPGAPRAVRVNNRTCRSFSRAAMRLETACWVIDSAADRKRIPRSWVPRLGILLAAGSVGLLVGFAVPVVGTLAAIGLVLYFTGALIAHLRVGSRTLVGWAVFFVTVVTNLVVNLAYHL
jgi:DoxX-like family/Putative threonine/serine exporter